MHARRTYNRDKINWYLFYYAQLHNQIFEINWINLRQDNQIRMYVIEKEVMQLTTKCFDSDNFLQQVVQKKISLC